MSPNWPYYQADMHYREKKVTKISISRGYRIWRNFDILWYLSSEKRFSRRFFAERLRIYHTIIPIHFQETEIRNESFKFFDHVTENRQEWVNRAKHLLDLFTKDVRDVDRHDEPDVSKTGVGRTVLLHFQNCHFQVFIQLKRPLYHTSLIKPHRLHWILNAGVLLCHNIHKRAGFIQGISGENNINAGINRQK